eukprot:scaffold2363_cov159-Amphora_coffeaeformis.AAC.15
MGCGSSHNHHDGATVSPGPLAAGAAMSEATNDDKNNGLHQRGGTFVNATELGRRAKEAAQRDGDDSSHDLDSYLETNTMGRALRTGGGPKKGAKK